jgi:hypothetical protein
MPGLLAIPVSAVMKKPRPGDGRGFTSFPKRSKREILDGANAITSPRFEEGCPAPSPTPHETFAIGLSRSSSRCPPGKTKHQCTPSLAMLQTNFACVESESGPTPECHRAMILGIPSREDKDAKGTIGPHHRVLSQRSRSSAHGRCCSQSF